MLFTFIGTCCEGRMFFLSCLFSSYVFTSVTVSVFSFLLNQRERKACRLLVAWNNGPIFILCYWTPGVSLLQRNHAGSTCKKIYSQQWRVFVFVHMPLVFRPILSTVVQGSVFFPPSKKDQGLSFLASWGVEGMESAVLPVPFLGVSSHSPEACMLGSWVLLNIQ